MADNIPNIDFNVAPGETVAVPVDATLSISGQAADAKAVGDALANKADKSELARSIHVNGQGADLQGEIILTAEHVPMDENETVTVAEEVEALKSRTGADIPVNGEDGAISIEAALNAASSGVTVQGGAAVMAGTVTDDSGSVNSLEISGRSLPLRDDGAVRSVNGIAGDSAGNVRITNVETANNLVADDAQSNVAAFVLRTSGGGTAIANGRAWLNQVRGAMEHTGVVEERIDMTVEPAAREAGQQAITATIDRAAFRAAVTESGTIALVYGTQDWSEDPASMGITVSGTPVEGDRITVEYDKADRGLITPATPTSFRSTGWNLYSHARGYARVVRYSEIYGFRVAGAYTSLTYSETETGARQTITPVDGAFNVPGDGYVWVAGGNASTTAIYMTWSDWTDGYEGSFAAYTESAISLATIMAEHFPDGLLAVGGVADVIDLDLKTATIAIERLDYSEETIAQLEAAGRAYEADTDYIYAVLEEPVTVTDIGVSNQFTVNDHGMEYVTGTTVAPVLMLLYGQNLRDKLRMDVVTISQQTLSSAQQAQVRTNLGITPANIGALPASGGQMTGNITVNKDGSGVFLRRTDGSTKGVDIYTSASEGGKVKLYSANGVNVYWLDVQPDNGTSFRLCRETLDSSLSLGTIFRITQAGDVIPYGNVNMGQNSSGSGKKLIWTTPDNTKFEIRPYNNLFQIVRTPSGGSGSNVLGFNSDGTVLIENPANWRKSLGIQSGAFTVESTSGGTYTDTDVTFPATFASVPIVVVGFRTASTAAAFGHCSCAVVSGSITTTGCTIRFYNGDTSPRIPEITWVAIAR